MSNIIDISGKITNQLPVVKITDDIVVTINNRKNTILNIQAMAQETEKKAAASGEAEHDQMKFMQKVLSMLIGEKNAKTIDELNLPMPEYTYIYQTIMDIATGIYDKPSTP